jgi:hypothetical protein
VERLDELRGPIGGMVDLDPRLHWSGRTRFDLDNPRRLGSFYETVIREATSEADLVRWLDGPTLVRLWPSLVIPPRVRMVWQTRFPELVAERRTAA